jgi:response regulator RpfG family c-di-GMP phosphodiesterase
MTQTGKIRLDEILIREKLISAEQIQEALLRQKKQGGKFGSQLLYHRYIDEGSLVKALSIQLNCDGVVLSNLNIPESVLKMVPSKLALTRMALPFDYDSKTNTLRVACSDPQDQTLINELNFIAQGKKIKLYVAAELSLETMVSRYYLGRDADLNDKLLVEIPDLMISSEPSPEETAKIQARQQATIAKSVLIVTDEQYTGSLLESILERDGYRVRVCDTAAEAIDIVSHESYSAIFVKDSVENPEGDLPVKLRALSPRSTMRLYDSAGTLLLNDDAYLISEDIVKRNLALFTALLSSKDNIADNHAASVGRYVEKLSQKLNLQPRERLTIITAAYLHDIAKHYGEVANGDDYRGKIDASIKLLESFEYSKSVTAILGLMYKDLQSDNAASLSFEALGGSMLTIVDLFCENVAFDKNFTLEKFDAIKKRLRDYSGKFFPGDVVEAFISIVQEEILNLQTVGLAGKIALFSNDPMSSYPLALRLKNEGFKVTLESFADKYVAICAEMHPDFIIIQLKGPAEQVAASVSDFASRGLPLKDHPAILMTETSAIPQLASLLETGIEDILPFDASYELLVAKIHRAKSRLLARNQNKPLDEQLSGARGRLADMNLIDLMQALAPGRRTVKITVSPTAISKDKLVIFLNKGNIMFGEMGDKKGADAIYEAMTWVDGVWAVESIQPENLPTANIQTSNDSILMEGAYRLDEKLRAGKLQ